MLLLAGAVVWVLTLSGRPLGRGPHIYVAMHKAGPLHEGAKVILAGQVVGEVARVRFVSPAASRSVELDLALERRWAPLIARNSQFFVATPSVLAEAYLEIGAPPGNLPRSGPIADGDRVQGADPPDIDRLLQYAEANLRTVEELLRAHRAEIDALFMAGDQLLATLSGLEEGPGQLRRIGAQVAAAVDAGRGLVATVREAGGVERIRANAHELGQIAAATAPELRALGHKLDLVLARVDSWADLFSPAHHDELSRAIATLRRAVTEGVTISTEVAALAAAFEEGQGSLGGLLHDRELFDDLHETHRIIKSRPWSLILKPAAKQAKKGR